MEARRARKWWVGTCGSVLAVPLLFLSGCASMPFAPASQPQTAASLPSADDDDWAQLNAQLRADLSRYTSREVVRKPTIAPTATTKVARDREFAERAQALFAPLNGSQLRMPVVGVRSRDLDDSWHAPRDGGSRVHKGIDIFAPKGTEVIAVADG